MTAIKTSQKQETLNQHCTKWKHNRVMFKQLCKAESDRAKFDYKVLNYCKI